MEWNKVLFSYASLDKRQKNKLKLVVNYRKSGNHIYFI